MNKETGRIVIVAIALGLIFHYMSSMLMQRDGQGYFEGMCALSGSAGPIRDSATDTYPSAIGGGGATNARDGHAVDDYIASLKARQYEDGLCRLWELHALFDILTIAAFAIGCWIYNERRPYRPSKN